MGIHHCPVTRMNLGRLLILHFRNQRPNMRQQLDRKLIACFQEFARILCGADAGGCTGEDDRAGGEGGTLGEEAD